MKTVLALVIAMVASLSFGGCCHPLGYHPLQFPALAVNPPYGKFPIRKTTGIYVQLNARNLPSDVVKQAKLFIDHVPQPFDTLIKADPGKRHTISFNYRPIPGYVTPPSMPVSVFEGRTTCAIATYNPIQSAHKGAAPKGHQVRAISSATSSPSQGAVACTWDYIQTAEYANGRIDCVWSSGIHPYARWWLVPGGPQNWIGSSQGAGVVSGVGLPYVYFEQVAGWHPPAYPYNYCQVYTARYNKTTVWVYYAPE